MKSINKIILFVLILLFITPVDIFGADALYRLMHNDHDTLKMGVLPFSLALIALVIALIRSKR